MRSFWKETHFFKILKIFGEICVRKGLQDQLENKGDLYLIIGYSKGHYHNTFRLFNLDTKKAVESRLYSVRSGVESLLYLVKHSRPDLANCVRELSKVIDRLGYTHWKALLSAIKYFEVTKDHVLQIYTTEK
jgi:hypothetical protein